MNAIIRPATIDDAEQIGALIVEFQAYLASLGDTTPFAFDAATYARDGFGDDPAFAGFVADEGGEIAGYLLYHFGYDTDAGRRIVFLIDLYVRESSRRGGIARALMDRLADAGRANRATAVVWSVYKPNVVAKRFYERLGARYLDSLDFMAIDIG